MYSVTQEGVLKRIETWQVIIPLHDNDGRPFSEEMIESILDNITLSFPGLTMVNCTGRWRGNDRVFIDKNMQVLIDALPLAADVSASYFAGLKKDLQAKLGQEKIYVTKESSKEEMLSYEEFLKEVGIEVEEGLTNSNKKAVIEQIVGRLDFVMQRMGYETLSIRRDRDAKKIVWERLLSGIRLTTTLDDPYPDGISILAADQIDRQAQHLFDENCVLIGHYEFQRYAIERQPIKPLVKSTIETLPTFQCIEYMSPQGDILNVRQFVERFTMSVVTNIAVLRDHGYRPDEISVNVGSDGSLQIGRNSTASHVLHQPAHIPDKEVQQEILRCLSECCEKFESGTFDPFALHQAKALNQYILKRAFLRWVQPAGE